MAKEFSKRFLKARALSLVRSGEIEAGIEKYKQYLELNPEDDDAWAGLGGAYRRKGDIGQAIESYEKAFNINERSTYALVNIVSLGAARNWEQDQTKRRVYLPKAIQLVREDIETGEGDYWSWYDLATLQLIQGDVEEAVRTFNYAADLTPATAKENFRSVLNNLNFLKEHNPSIEGISIVVEVINQYLS